LRGNDDQGIERAVVPGEITLDCFGVREAQIRVVDEADERPAVWVVLCWRAIVTLDSNT
jgi:hypothetical protein